MYKFALVVVTLSLIIGCSSNQGDIETSSTKNNYQSTDVTLSHVKAYLLNGNIQKAEQLFNTYDASELDTQSMLVLAELHSARGNSVEAQKVFLTTLADRSFELPMNKTNIPTDLLDYFCEQKKWPALQGYGAALINTADDQSLILTPTTRNHAFTKIGLCLFYQQRWQDSQYWLAKVDLSERVPPLVYLALARAHLEQQKYSDAQRLINQYEDKKDAVDPQSLWASIEVYMALKQPGRVRLVGENMLALFPHHAYTRNYISLIKRGANQAITNSPTSLPDDITDSQTQTQTQTKETKDGVHFIQKGETLYQLSRRYAVTAAELMSWNPDLVVDDIALGTPIRIIAPETK